MSNILVPIDFVPSSSDALRYSLQFADRLGKELILLHVIYPDFERMDLPVVSLQATKEKIEAARTKLQRLVDEVFAQIQIEHGLDDVPILRADIEIGTPGPVIQTTTQYDDVEMTIMGMRDKHSTLEKWFGSVSDHVVARSYKPVMVLPQNTLFKAPQRILYASDFTSEDRSSIAWITEQWKAFEPQIDILHFYSKDQQKSAVVYEEQLHVIDGLRSEFPGLNMVTLESDDIVSGLAEYAAEHTYDMIAMYSPRRQWWDSMTHSSVTKKVLALRKSPMLILK